jgi:SAM-dependent methyltransferase
VLDIGSGTGFMVDTWMEAAIPNVSGCDITTVAVSNLACRWPALSFERIDFGDSTVPYSCEFDAISANDVLFHIVDDGRYQRAVTNVFSALRPGGFFLFTDNFVHGAAIRVEHQASRTLGDITDVLADAGFEIVDRQPLFVLMNDPIDSTSRLLRLWWRSVTRLLRTAPMLGGVVGALLYLPELWLGRVLAEGPSTELMLCRRPVEPI